MAHMSNLDNKAHAWNEAVDHAAQPPTDATDPQPKHQHQQQVDSSPPQRSKPNVSRSVSKFATIGRATVPTALAAVGARRSPSPSPPALRQPSPPMRPPTPNDVPPPPPPPPPPTLFTHAYSSLSATGRVTSDLGPPPPPPPRPPSPQHAAHVAARERHALLLADAAKKRTQKPASTSGRSPAASTTTTAAASSKPQPRAGRSRRLLQHSSLVWGDAEDLALAGANGKGVDMQLPSLRPGISTDAISSYIKQGGGGGEGSDEEDGNGAATTTAASNGHHAVATGGGSNNNRGRSTSSSSSIAGSVGSAASQSATSGRSVTLHEAHEKQRRARRMSARSDGGHYHPPPGTFSSFTQARPSLMLFRKQPQNYAIARAANMPRR